MVYTHSDQSEIDVFLSTWPAKVHMRHHSLWCVLLLTPGARWLNPGTGGWTAPCWLRPFCTCPKIPHSSFKLLDPGLSVSFSLDWKRTMFDKHLLNLHVPLLESLRLCQQATDIATHLCDGGTDKRRAPICNHAEEGIFGITRGVCVGPSLWRRICASRILSKINWSGNFWRTRTRDGNCMASQEPQCGVQLLSDLHQISLVISGDLGWQTFGIADAGNQFPNLFSTHCRRKGTTNLHRVCPVWASQTKWLEPKWLEP